MADFCCQFQDDAPYQAQGSPFQLYGTQEDNSLSLTKKGAPSRKYLRVTAAKAPFSLSLTDQNSPRPTVETLISTFRSASDQRGSLNMICKELSYSRQDLNPPSVPNLTCKTLGESPQVRLATSPIHHLWGLVSVETQSIIKKTEPVEDDLKSRVQRLCRTIPLAIGRE